MGRRAAISVVFATSLCLCILLVGVETASAAGVPAISINANDALIDRAGRPRWPAYAPTVAGEDAACRLQAAPTAVVQELRDWLRMAVRPGLLPPGFDRQMFALQRWPKWHGRDVFVGWLVHDDRLIYIVDDPTFLTVLVAPLHPTGKPLPAAARTKLAVKVAGQVLAAGLLPNPQRPPALLLPRPDGVTRGCWTPAARKVRGRRGNVWFVDVPLKPGPLGVDFESDGTFVQLAVAKSPGGPRTTLPPDSPRFSQPGKPELKGMPAS